ncbi:MAG TPA: hypothetical protein VJC12_02410 [Candidatus Paceibacterota bacterium]
MLFQFDFLAKIVSLFSETCRETGLPRKLYIALDTEAAGPELGIHSTISIGAVVITRDLLKYRDYEERGWVFYSELKPLSYRFSAEAMKIACSQLDCIQESWEVNPVFVTGHKDFKPDLVLKLMRKICPHPDAVMRQFYNWIQERRVEASAEEIVGVTDTVFFDSGRISLLFGQHCPFPSPFGWRGLDLTSLFKGYTGLPDASLSELGVPDIREKPHRADHDAVYLAQMARKLLFETLGW